MRKKYILILALFFILLVGCNNKTETSEISSKFDKIIAELSQIPEKYTVEKAVEDGCFVVVHGKVKSDLKIIDEFVSNSENGKSASITVVQYTIEGDPIITKVIYDGTNYYGIEDNTRDDYGTPQYQDFEFKYLKIFEEHDSKMYILFNDNEITYDEYIKSMLSSSSEAWIDHRFICSYDK